MSQDYEFHGVWVAYYNETYRGIVPIGQGLPHYSKRVKRLEGVVQPQNKTQVSQSQPPLTREGGS